MSFKFFHGIIKPMRLNWPEGELSYIHGIDIEQELTNQLSLEISREINNERVNRLRRINEEDNQIA